MSAVLNDPVPTPMQSAMRLAEEEGLPVFPCRARDEIVHGKTYRAKSPLTLSGFKDACKNLDQIEAWWSRWPDALVGVPMGPSSGLFALDFDPRGLPWYSEHAHKLGAGRVHKTRRGYHLIYKHSGIGNTSNRLSDGIDTRGNDEGYIIWWPAHGATATGEMEDIGPLPEWVAQKLAAPEKPKAVNGSLQDGVGVDKSADLLARVGRDIRAGLADYEIHQKHAGHPHVLAQTDGARAIQRCIDKARAGAADQKNALGTVIHGELKVTTMSSIAAKPIEPLWAGCLYRGKLTVIAGIPGDGKSLLADDICARISAGAAWPVGDGSFAKSTVFLLTAEDDPADTIRPRLDVAGADNDLIKLIGGAYHVDEKTGERTLDMVSLISDLPAIERQIVDSGASLLVVDPLTSFSDSDTNKTGESRRLFDGMAQMAARTGVAILIITHMNKRSDARKAMQMIAGSHVIVAAVRVVLVTARDPNDKARRLLLPIKLNIGPDDTGFAFRVTPRVHAVCGDVPACEWEADGVEDMSADDVLIDNTPRAQAAVEKSNEVQDWLREYLKREPVAASSLWAKAKEMGYGERRVKQALKVIKASCEILGYQGKWHWRLTESGTK